MGKKLEHFFQSRYIDGNKHKKRFSTALVITEMQIKTMRYHFMLIRRATIKKAEITSIGEDVEKLECLYTVGGNGVPSMEKSMELPQIFKNRTTIWSAIPLLGIYHIFNFQGCWTLHFEIILSSSVFLIIYNLNTYNNINFIIYTCPPF